jgi:aminoglycoside phosphotransferase family enzyme/predicted kinase
MSHDQAALVRALESGEALGESGPLRRIDTHLSHIFLGRERAYKLKRAVRMPFVDFTSLEARRRACEAELGINLALAPELYLGVEPVVRVGGGFRVGGAGEPADWLVIMRRFKAGALFDEMARARTLTPARIGEAAEVVARFHEGAEAVPGAGGPEDYLAIVRGLRRTEADGAAAHGLSAGPDRLYAELEAAMGRSAALIEARRREGRVRRGHGDLHLRNICLFRDRATPFDALEFDPALASADVLYDLAFLLMDLRRRGLGLHANVAMNRYWDAAGEDEAGLALLAPFMALRAAVRTAVAMEAGDAVEAQAYRALGLRLLAPERPRLVAVGGLSGSGKSVVAARIAPDLPGPCGARLLRTDVIRKAGGPVGPDAYAPERRAEVYETLAARAADALAAGCSVLADATFQDAEARAGIASGSPLDALWLEAPAEVRITRVAARTGDVSDADAAVAARQEEPWLEPPWTVIDASGPLDEVVDKARLALHIVLASA